MKQLHNYTLEELQEELNNTTLIKTKHMVWLMLKMSERLIKISEELNIKGDD